MQRYFTVTTETLRAMDDYDKSQNVYRVSPDISVNRAVSQTAQYFRIDDIVMKDNGYIEVLYRIIWGNMAASGDGTDIAFAGNILLEKKDENYFVRAVEITENNSDKYIM